MNTRPRFPTRTTVVVLALALLAADARAQQALVLSGGGARGLAHVGVLLHLDSLGYDPDIVVGNSMGAVIGALYAAGYDATEIRERVAAVNWGGMFDPTATLLGPQRGAELPMLSFGLDLSESRVSRGLFGEWRINRILARLLFEANARARGDFDRLARRYRTVAADLESGEKVVLDSGDVALAVRASMAFPGFWAPVRWGDRVLIDGGVVDNLPTAEARRLGASHIVAVDVSRPSRRVSSIEALAVAQRALNLMQQNLHPDPEPPDVLVAPLVDSGLLGAAFPEDPSPIVAVGLDAARRDAPNLPAGGRARRSLPPAPTRYDALRIEAPDPALAAITREAFAGVAPGEWDPEAVLAAMDRLFSTGLVEAIWPRVADPDTAGAGPALVVRVDAPARLTLSGAAGFENDRGGRAWVALERYTALGRRPALLSAAAFSDGLRRWAALAARIHLGGRFGMAWSAGGHAQEVSVRTFRDDTRETAEVIRTGGWAGLELPHILRDRVITLTGRAEWVDPEDTPAGESYGPVLRIASRPTDARIVGVPLLLEAEARWGAFRYRQASVAASRTLALGTLQAAPLIDVRTVSHDAPVDVYPALGDQHAVPGLRWGEQRGRARVVAGADVALPVAFGGFARLRLRSGTVAERPAAWNDARWISGAQIGGFWRIPFGTLEAGYGRATSGDGRFDVSVGRRF